MIATSTREWNYNHKEWIRDNRLVPIAAVEATSFEQFSLWQKYAKEIDWKDKPTSFPMVTIGQLDKRPIVLSLELIEIYGKQVLFYHPTSQVVDWVLIEEFIEEFFPTTRGHRSDAMNFFNIAHYCKDHK